MEVLPPLQGLFTNSFSYLAFLPGFTNTSAFPISLLYGFLNRLPLSSL